MSSSTDNNGDAKVGKARKFLFDTHNFDDPSAQQEEDQEEAPVFSEEDLAAAQQSGFDAGRQDGLREAQSSQEETVAAALERIAAAAEHLVQAEDRRETEQQAATVNLALAMARKLFPDMARKTALSEIEAAVIAVLDDRHDEPRVAVVVHDTLLEPLKARIDDISAARGFAGKVIVIADEKIAPTDCRIEWADGGAERKFDALLTQMEEELQRAVRNLEAGAPSEQPQTQTAETPKSAQTADTDENVT